MAEPLRLKIIRFSHQEHSTNGIMFVDGLFECYTLEDEYRAVKREGETRIPAGKYQIKLRKEGGLYSRKAEDWGCKEGMLWLQDVPGFEWIYIHPGNKHEHTSGCILVGDSQMSNLPRVGEGFVSHSVASFKALYAKCLDAMKQGKEVWVQIAEM